MSNAKAGVRSMYVWRRPPPPGPSLTAQILSFSADGREFRMYLLRCYLVRFRGHRTAGRLGLTNPARKNRRGQA